MPHLNIDLFEGRDAAKKQELVGKLTEVVCEVLGCEPRAVTIILNECSRENWAAGGLLHSNKPKE